MTINPEKCTRCGICAEACYLGVIDLERKTIDTARCIHCGHCMAYCPKGAVFEPGADAPALGALPSAEQMAALTRARRSCRNYKDAPVTRETLSLILDNLRYAPTGSNTEAVTVSVLSTREAVKRVADAMFRFLYGLSKLAALLTPLLALAIGPKKVRRALGMRRLLAQYQEGTDIITYGAPAMLAFSGPGTASTPEEDGVIWATTAVYHAETLGLGTCWNGFVKYSAQYNRKIRKLLGIPKGNRLHSVVLLGWPKLAGQRGVIRKPADAVWVE